jgi:hypothetical protein
MNKKKERKKIRLSTFNMFSVLLGYVEENKYIERFSQSVPPISVQK